METRTPVKEETISRAKLDSHEAALTNLPPIKKVSSLPRDNSKAASTYSNPSFKRLISAEKRKLAKDGFLDESRNKIKFVDSRYKSMPTLNSMEQESPRSAKGSVQSAEYPQSQPKGMDFDFLYSAFAIAICAFLFFFINKGSRSNLLFFMNQHI